MLERSFNQMPSPNAVKNFAIPPALLARDKTWRNVCCKATLAIVLGLFTMNAAQASNIVWLTCDVISQSQAKYVWTYEFNSLTNQLFAYDRKYGRFTDVATVAESGVAVTPGEISWTIKIRGSDVSFGINRTSLSIYSFSSDNQNFVSNGSCRITPSLVNGPQF